MIVDQATAAVWPEISQADRAAMRDAWMIRDVTHPLREVEVLLANISQGMWASSWSSGIDRDAWMLLRDPEYRREEAGQNHPYCSGPELAQMLDRLEELTISRGWFPIYDLDTFDARVASLEAATRTFATAQ